MKTLNIPKLLFSFFFCFLAGGIGSVFTVSSIPTWYSTLRKPFFTPPNWLFGPAWTTLYILMAISLYIVWNTKSKNHIKQTGMNYFFAQLVFNALWSIIFFGLQSPFFGFITIVILWILIFVTIRNFFKVSTVAGWLLIPYIAWVTFAGLLNLGVVILNM